MLFPFFWNSLSHWEIFPPAFSTVPNYEQIPSAWLFSSFYYNGVKLFALMIHVIPSIVVNPSRLFFHCVDERKWDDGSENSYESKVIDSSFRVSGYCWCWFFPVIRSSIEEFLWMLTRLILEDLCVGVVRSNCNAVEVVFSWRWVPSSVEGIGYFLFDLVKAVFSYSFLR